MIYEYQCSECEHIFEIVCSMSESDVKRPCPECQSETERYYNSMPMAIPADKLMLGSKISGGFRDVLHSIASRTPGGEVMRKNIR